MSLTAAYPSKSEIALIKMVAFRPVFTQHRLVLIIYCVAHHKTNTVLGTIYCNGRLTQYCRVAAVVSFYRKGRLLERGTGGLL